MKDTCNHKKARCPVCGTGFLKSEKYTVVVCPMCLVKDIEYITGGIMKIGDDGEGFLDLSDAHWYHVVINELNQPIVVNNITFKRMQLSIPVRSVFQGKIDHCSNYIKSITNEKKKDKGPPDADMA